MLAVSRQRVKMVETRPLTSEWQVVFDILPEMPNAKGAPRNHAEVGASAAVDGLAVTLASLLHTPESRLFLGDVTRHANGTAGLHRLVQRRVEKWQMAVWA